MFGGGAFPPSAQTGYPVSISNGCFRDKNNNPTFALAEDAAELATALTAADVELYLADRSARGVNLIWVQGLENILGASPPNNANGDAPFTGGVDFVSPNSAYWNYVEYVIQRCRVWGIAVAFNPMFFGLSNSSGYRNSVMTSSDAVVQAWADYLAGKFGGYDNVHFLIGGDLDPNNATGMAKINTFATRLKSGASSRLMTMEASRFKEDTTAAPNGGYSSVDAHTIAYGSTQSWLDYNWAYQTQATCLSGAQRCNAQGLPAIMGEAIYESDSHALTALQLRVEERLSVLGGCTLGFIFGNGPIWSFNLSGGGSTTPSWKTQLASTGSLDFQRFGKLVRSRRHQLLVPDTTGAVLTASTGGAGARDSEAKSILAYLPSSQTATIDMSKITDSGSQAKCWWHDPTNGAVTSIGTFSTSGTRNFTTPGNNSAGDPDWDLVIDSNAAGLRTPGT